MYNAYVIGNGFSINLMKLLNKGTDIIDLKNLFSKGYVVPCPDDTLGFLSQEYCPRLWKLGARCFNDEKTNIQIINNIISSYKVYELRLAQHRAVDNDPQLTYFELNKYLRNLFFYYNQLVTDDDLKKVMDSIPILNMIGSNDIIISYNYDIFLERILSLKKRAKVSICNGVKNIQGLQIYKPHGSIDFSIDTTQTKILTSPYDYKPSEITICSNFDKLHSTDLQGQAFIIPPFDYIIGNSGCWVEHLRSSIQSALKGAPQKITFYGLSYDVVDRSEINEIISCINSGSHVEYVNPKPSPELDYILTQQFKFYKQKIFER